MSAFRPVLIVMAMSLSTAALAEEFDGTKPMECTMIEGHDCLPTQASCGPLKPESGKTPVFQINAAKKEIRSPFRTALLPVITSTSNRESLVLQGADLLFAWSALINKTTGAITVSVADRKGAYVVFGQCKLVAAG